MECKQPEEAAADQLEFLGRRANGLLRAIEWGVAVPAGGKKIKVYK
jgi:hypothetical protein